MSHNDNGHGKSASHHSDEDVNTTMFEIDMKERELNEVLSRKAANNDDDKSRKTTSSSLLRVATELIALCNQKAMQLVDTEDYKVAHSLLKKALQFTNDDENSILYSFPSRRLRLRATCLNNIGCYFKRQQRLRKALHFLEQAASIESSISDPDNPAGTHLNICATLSELGSHFRAVTHAKIAIDTLASDKSQKPDASNSLSVVPHSSFSRRELGLLSKAYYNLAVENEYLGHDTDALLAYKQAHQVAIRVWGEAHSVTAVMKSALKSFVAKRRGVTPVQHRSIPRRCTSAPINRALANGHRASSSLSTRVKKHTIPSTYAVALGEKADIYGGKRSFQRQLSPKRSLVDDRPWSAQ